jgi:two-component system, NarL family, sensor histidine kinase UhpB
MHQEVTVLVVENNPTDVDLILKALSNSTPSTFRIELASRLSEALTRLKDDHVDVVLLDLELPGSQGLNTFRAVRSAAPRTPIVVLVSRENEAIGHAALRLGARDYVVKGAVSELALWRAFTLAIRCQRALEALEDSEDFGRAALDGLSDHIAILDESGFILMVNRAWREFAKANLGDVANVCEGASYLGVCDAAVGESSEGAREMAQAIRAVLAGEERSFALEYPCHSPDQERWFAARLNPVSAAGPHRAIIAHENITERKHAEEKLRASEGLYRAVVEDQTEVICRFKADGTLMFVNEVYCRFFGKEADDLIGKKWQPLAFAEDLPHIEAQVSTLSPSNPVSVIENRVHSATGEVHWMQFVNRAFYDWEGHLAEIQSVGRDITERKRAEADLTASEARLRALYENSLVGIMFTAPDGRIFNANPAACRILGRTEEEIRKLGRFGLLDPQDPNLAALVAQRARAGTVQGTVTFIRRDGTRFPADTASVIFETSEGPRTCTIIQDVTEREATAEQIRDFSRRLLSIREEEKHRLSAALHHDVGSMSVGVGARLQAAEEDLRAGKPQQAIAALKECRRLFDESVQWLKALAMELRPPDLDILGLPVALRQHFALVTRNTPLHIIFTEATRSVAIESEIETALFRIAQECLNNVIKHAEASRVRVRIAIGKRGLQLSIADDGKGFDPDPAAGRASEGMGLRAVREMMRAHGGELIVDSAPGKGTKIRAVFPLGGARS